MWAEEAGRLFCGGVGERLQPCGVAGAQHRGGERERALSRGPAPRPAAAAARPPHGRAAAARQWGGRAQPHMKAVSCSAEIWPATAAAPPTASVARRVALYLQGWYRKGGTTGDRGGPAVEGAGVTAAGPARLAATRGRQRGYKRREGGGAQPCCERSAPVCSQEVVAGHVEGVGRALQAGRGRREVCWHSGRQAAEGGELAGRQAGSRVKGELAGAPASLSAACLPPLQSKPQQATCRPRRGPPSPCRAAGLPGGC